MSESGSEQPSRKRKRKREVRSLTAIREKYVPLLNREESADRVTLGIGMSTSLAGAIKRSHPSIDYWKGASHLAPVRLLKLAIVDGDVTAVKWCVLKILERLGASPPQEISDGVFKPWPMERKLGSPFKQDTLDLYAGWKRAGRQPIKEFVESIYGIGLTGHAFQARVKTVGKQICRCAEAEIREMELELSKHRSDTAETVGILARMQAELAEYRLQSAIRAGRRATS